MNDDLFQRVLIQLQPELAQEFGLAALEDRKRLKAFEIIKEKQVDIAMILSCESADDYNRWCDTGASWSNEHIAQEEFDLLKEELL